MIQFAIPGTPIPQARARHRVVKLRNGQTFVGQYDPAKSRSWKAMVADYAFRAMRGNLFEGPVILEATFVFPPLASWPKKRLARLASGAEIVKGSRPDLDNLLKGILDGCNGICWRDDGQLCEVRARKVYGLRPEVRITVTAHEESPDNGKPAAAAALLPLEGVLP